MSSVPHPAPHTRLSDTALRVLLRAYNRMGLEEYVLQTTRTLRRRSRQVGVVVLLRDWFNFLQCLEIDLPRTLGISALHVVLQVALLAWLCALPGAVTARFRALDMLPAALRSGVGWLTAPNLGLWLLALTLLMQQLQSADQRLIEMLRPHQEATVVAISTAVDVPPMVAPLPGVALAHSAGVPVGGQANQPAARSQSAVNDARSTVPSSAAPQLATASAPATASVIPNATGTAQPASALQPTMSAPLEPTATATTGTTAVPPPSIAQPTNTPLPTAAVPPTNIPQLTHTALPTPSTIALPTATAQPLQPTNTPVPTATAQPTNTPVPTATAQPTSTPQPTQTALPTPSATPMPTATSQPTSPPQPTSTPVPTATAQPPSTPQPTSTPCPVASSHEIMLVVDLSTSISDKELQSVRVAIARLLDQVDFSRDRVGLVTFSSRAAVKIPLGADRAELDQFLTDMDSKGGSNIAAGISTARAVLEQSDLANTSQAAIVLFTDGDAKGADDAVRAAADQAKLQHIRLMSVGVGKRPAEELLREIASSTTDYYLAAEPEHMVDLYTSLATNRADCD